jgi:hypothetical protein
VKWAPGCAATRQPAAQIEVFLFCRRCRGNSDVTELSVDQESELNNVCTNVDTIETRRWW